MITAQEVQKFTVEIAGSFPADGGAGTNEAQIVIVLHAGDAQEAEALADQFIAPWVSWDDHSCHLTNETIE